MAPVHPGSPPPRKRMMLAGQVQCQAGAGVLSTPMSVIRQQCVLEVLEQSPLQLGRQRRHHSDPGACLLKMQHRTSQPTGLFAAPMHPSTHAAAGANAVLQIVADSTQYGAGSSKLSIKRERRSSTGDADKATSSTAAGSSPPSFTITVDCRSIASDSAATATALWQRMHQLELRNKELEQQLVERMQATRISNSSSVREQRQQQQQQQQQQPAWQPGQQFDKASGSVSPRAHAELAQADDAAAMDIESCLGSGSSTAAQALVASSASSQQQQQQQQEQHAQTDSMQMQQQGLDAQGPQQLVHSLRHQVQRLQKDLKRQKQLNTMLTSDNTDLESVLKETERQRREFAARYAFMTLDTDGDGYVSVEQVLTYDLFSCYAPSVLMAAFSVWRWDSGFPGYLCMDDFVRFVEYAEDRSTRESQRFWFTVCDADGDGRLSWADMKLLYDAVQRSCRGGALLNFADLMCQITDMVTGQRQPDRGFTAKELWDCKLGAGVIGLLTNANNMLLQRSTAEWGRGDFPL